MAESVRVIECPATPELIDQCPDTPERLLNVKSPNDSSSSDNECSSSINLRTRNTNSPPPNCAICLGRCKNKCFTDSCLHQFCFKCLLEWSKVKAECPLCKQPFNSIIHNVKSIDQFEEYLVAQPQQTLTPAHIMGRFDVYLGEYPRFRSEVSNGFSTTVQVHPNDNETIQQIFLHRSLLVERLRQDYPDGIIPSSTLGQLWRRYIYDRRLYAMPVVDITGRYRDCSARFFRDNPAQMHRIMAWINRDVICLLRDSGHHVSYVMNVMGDLLSTFNITSPEFRRRLQAYFRRRTAHFIHELLNFARSPYDMIGYDREVRYSPYYEEVIISSSTSSSSGFSDSEDVIHVRGGGGQANAHSAGSRRAAGRTTEFTIETRANNSTFILAGSINGGSVSNAGTSAGSSVTVPPSTSRPAGIFEVSTAAAPVSGMQQPPQPQILGESQVIQIDRNNIMISSSSSDECEFVSERKPPHLRTPEQVSLNSESDSDVVFVSELKKTPPAEAAATTLTTRPSRKRRPPPKGVFISTRSASPSAATSASDNETGAAGKVAGLLQKERKTTPEPKKDRNDTSHERIKIEDSKSKGGAAADKSNKKNAGGTSDVYNNGASTSSGLHGGSENKISKCSSCKNSSSNGNTTVKKFYARPVRQTTSKRLRNTKSIFEESSSSSDTDESSTEIDYRTKRDKFSSDSSSDDSSTVALSKLRSHGKQRNKRKRESRRNPSNGTSSKTKKTKKASRARKKTATTSKSTSKINRRRKPKSRRKIYKRTSSMSSATTSSSPTSSSMSSESESARSSLLSE